MERSMIVGCDPGKSGALARLDHAGRLVDVADMPVVGTIMVSFDKPWIDKLFYWADMELPYHHRSLCLRSMKFGSNPCFGFGSDRTTHQSLLPHHALADADAQAQDLIDMLNGRW